MDAGRPRPMPHQSHISWVAPKVGNIFLDPMKSCNLIQNPQIGGMPTFPVSVGVEEACREK